MIDYSKLTENFASVLQIAKGNETEGEKTEIPFYVPKLINGVATTDFSRSPSKPASSRSLGTLNPELYRFPEEGDLLEYPDHHIGRLWFTLEYDKDSEKLTVTLGKLRNLPSRDTNNANACDPFIRVFLLPDERRYMQSKPRRKTCNPKFDDSFTFDISKENFDERVLKFVVYDTDQLKRLVPIGSVQYTLKDYSLFKQKRLMTWKDLKKDDVETAGSIGEIHCSLCFNDHLQRLTLTLDETKDLRPLDESSDLDTYAKVVFSVGAKQVKTKKSRTVKGTTSPAFKESFAFPLSVDKLDQAGLSIQIIQVKGDRQLGRIVLGGSMFARGKALFHWQQMENKIKEVVQDWHYLSE